MSDYIVTVHYGDKRTLDLEVMAVSPKAALKFARRFLERKAKKTKVAVVKMTVCEKK